MHNGNLVECSESQWATAILGYKLYRRDREESVGGMWLSVKERGESCKVDLDSKIESNSIE